MIRYHSCFQTEQGRGGVVASERGLVEVLLPFGCPSSDEHELWIRDLCAGSPGESALTSRAASLLVRYFRGEHVSFELPLDIPHGSVFRESVYRFVAAIPWGIVKTYAEVAAATGSLQAFRAVGGALARNPVPVIIPCHRVVGASGAMTGYSAPGGIMSKEWLLSLEGVLCRENADAGRRNASTGVVMHKNK